MSAPTLGDLTVLQWPDLTSGDPTWPLVMVTWPNSWWPHLTTGDPTWPMVTQSDLWWPDLTPGDPTWLMVTQCDPRWSDLTGDEHEQSCAVKHATLRSYQTSAWFYFVSQGRFVSFSFVFVMYVVFLCLCYVVSTGVVDCLERLVSEMCRVGY